MLIFHSIILFHMFYPILFIYNDKLYRDSAIIKCDTIPLFNNYINNNFT